MAVQDTPERAGCNLFSCGEWRYAVLVILLLMVAAVAAKLAVDALAGHPDLQDAEGALTPIAVTIFTLTFGFLFLAGGFGIWAIRTTSEVEGLRRIGRFVDNMNYLSDPLLAVDAKGRVTGMNPAARDLAEGPCRDRARLEECFPCLTQKDLASLVSRLEAYEVERAYRRSDGLLRGLRFRSQNTGDAHLIMVSDVTAAKARQAQDVQSNHLQILGRLARAVAHDFNNILCAISAQAALARRSDTVQGGTAQALDAIVGLSARGADLADRLVSLSRIDPGGDLARNVEDHVIRSRKLLETALDTAWTVDTALPGSPVQVGVAGNQLEQILFGIGLTAADSLDRPGVLRLAVCDPTGRAALDPGSSKVAITLVASPGRPDEGQAWRAAEPVPADDTGVVASVIGSLLEDLGGSLSVFPTRDGSYAYQIVLPSLRMARDQIAAKIGIPDEIRSALEGRRTLLAMPVGQPAEDLEDRLQGLGLAASSTHTLPDLLGLIDEADPVPEALIIDRRVLGGEPNALIRAITKLLPSAMLVILSETPALDCVGMSEEIVFMPLDAPPDSIIEALARPRRAELVGVA